MSTAARVPVSSSGPGANGYWRKTRRADDEHRRRGRSASRSRGRSAGRWPANSGGPAGSRRGRRRTPARPGQPRRSASSTRAAQCASSSAPAPTTRAGELARLEQRASSSIASSSAAAERTSAPRPRARAAAALGPVVQRDDDDRRAARGAAAWWARTTAPGTSWARSGLLDGDRVVAGQARRRPARNGSSARWRRSCWPTSTTSGARLARAVASAPTALPRPGRRVQQHQRRRPRAERVARRHPDHEPSCRASTNVMSSGSPTRNGTSVDPGLAKIVVSPRSRSAAKRRVAHGGRSRVTARLYTKSFGNLFGAGAADPYDA